MWVNVRACVRAGEEEEEEEEGVTSMPPDVCFVVVFNPAVLLCKVKAQLGLDPRFPERWHPSLEAVDTLDFFELSPACESDVTPQPGHTAAVPCPTKLTE